MPCFIVEKESFKEEPIAPEEPTTSANPGLQRDGLSDVIGAEGAVITYHLTIKKAYTLYYRCKIRSHCPAVNFIVISREVDAVNASSRWSIKSSP